VLFPQKVKVSSEVRKDAPWDSIRFPLSAQHLFALFELFRGATGSWTHMSARSVLEECYTLEFDFRVLPTTQNLLRFEPPNHEAPQQHS
jgi:hypothetical protein